MTTLDLALITYGPDGLKRIENMNLPEISGVRYVISWQKSDCAPIPQALERPDVVIARTETRGAAVNRNNAITMCRADIILFSDDDLIYTPAQLQAVIDTFDKRPDLDLATFQATHPCNPVYPSQECRLGDPLPKGYWVSSYQIAFRRKSVGNLLCHPEFGAGAPRLIGADDELFLLSAIRRGLNCRFIPINICTHPDLSTGTTATLSAGNMLAMGCYITLAYPRSFPLRLLLKALRIKRHGQADFFKALKNLIAGSAEAPRIRRGDRRYLW